MADIHHIFDKQFFVVFDVAFFLIGGAISGH